MASTLTTTVAAAFSIISLQDMTVIPRAHDTFDDRSFTAVSSHV